jgi:hypothetical protein
MQHHAAVLGSSCAATLRVHSEHPHRCPSAAPQRKDSKMRMLTTFSVQASTNAFTTAQRVYKDGPGKVLPKVRGGGRCLAAAAAAWQAQQLTLQRLYHCLTCCADYSLICRLHTA